MSIIPHFVGTFGTSCGTFGTSFLTPSGVDTGGVGFGLSCYLIFRLIVYNDLDIFDGMFGTSCGTFGTSF